MATVNSGRANFDMTEQSDKLVFQYWGKADDKLLAGAQWHPLVYRCLDFAVYLA